MAKERNYLDMVADVKRFDGLRVATRKWVKEEMALTRVSTNQNAIEINHLYNSLADNKIDVQPLDDTVLMDVALRDCAEDRELLRTYRDSKRRGLFKKMRGFISSNDKPAPQHVPGETRHITPFPQPEVVADPRVSAQL